MDINIKIESVEEYEQFVTIARKHNLAFSTNVFKHFVGVDYKKKYNITEVILDVISNNWISAGSISTNVLKKCNCCYKTIKRALNELVSKGILESLRFRGGTSGNTTLYRLKNEVLN